MSRRSRRSIPAPRRGAMLVFVGLVVVVLAGMAAVALDVSRTIVGANELQSASDASALRGAHYLQFHTGASAESATRAFADSNYYALGAKVTLASADVLPIFWDPTKADPRTDLVGDWGDARTNAVEVWARQATTPLWGRLLDSTSRVTNRRSIAWVANVSRVRCPTPWGIPLNAFNSKVYGLNDFSTRAGAFDRLQEALVSPGPLALTMVLYHSDASAPTSVQGHNWGFEAMSGDMNRYPDQVAGAAGSCSADLASGINDVRTFTGKGGGSVPQKTYRGAMGHQSVSGSLCAVPTTNVADCYPLGSAGSGPAGVDVIVSWIGNVTNSSATVFSLGGFRVMCVFGGGNNESCAWYTAYRNANPTANLPTTPGQGVIVGYPVTVAPALGEGTSLGNTPSLAQRLVLVR